MNHVRTTYEKMNIWAVVNPKPIRGESTVQLVGSTLDICQGTIQVPQTKAVQTHTHSVLFCCAFFNLLHANEHYPPQWLN